MGTTWSPWGGDKRIKAVSPHNLIASMGAVDEERVQLRCAVILLDVGHR